MGLIAREIENRGIPTVAISIAKELTLAVGVPRALYLRWPLGHPLGEPHHRAQQLTVLNLALRLLLSAQVAGTLAEPELRWRRETYSEPNWTTLRDLGR